jgi:hypothetical protein
LNCIFFLFYVSLIAFDVQNYISLLNLKKTGLASLVTIRLRHLVLWFRSIRFLSFSKYSIARKL